MKNPVTRLMNLRFSDVAEQLRDRAVAECMIQPLGILHGRQAKDGVNARLATWLAGGPQAFTAVEIIEGRPGAASRELNLVRDLIGVRDPLVRTRLEQLCEPRAPMAGLSWGRPRIVGILNAASPDQAAQRGRKASTATTRGLHLAQTGADVVAVTADGAQDEDQAAKQVARVIAELKRAGIRLGVMSNRATVISAGLAAGARMVFDTGTLADEEVLYSLSDTKAPLVIRHQGPLSDDPNALPHADVAMAVHLALENRIEICEGMGISRRRIIVDPGLGVGKSPAENLALLNGLGLLHGLGCPIMIGSGSAVVLGESISQISESRTPAPEKDSAVIVASAFSHGVQLVAAGDLAADGDRRPTQVGRAWSVAAAYHSALSGLGEAH
ncbi:MAG: dihydropteroate synthase [Alphaproteobacteria bacterium]